MRTDTERVVAHFSRGCPITADRQWRLPYQSTYEDGWDLGVVGSGWSSVGFVAVESMTVPSSLAPSALGLEGGLVGWPLWTSDVRPGREHDTTCVRIPKLAPFAARSEAGHGPMPIGRTGR